MQAGGERAVGHLQREQPAGGAFGGSDCSIIIYELSVYELSLMLELLLRSIVEGWNDVARDLGVGFGIAGEQAIVGRNAAIGTLRVEDPAQ